MNAEDVDFMNQMKQPRVVCDALPRVDLGFLRASGNKVKNRRNPHLDLQALAEDELVRKEYEELYCEMPGSPRSTFLMVFSPDGTKVASTHGNHNIYVTDLRSGKNIKTLMGHPRTPWCIAFHPTCNELLASGCLGGQVRVWDLSGGSEVWTANSQTVIASIAFHPSDRILVIATYNELYFWDWSKREPFTHTATCNTKEKVRYVAFDRLGLKLITGIANTPQYRWDRSRIVTSQSRSDRMRPCVPTADRAANPSRRRSVPRSLGSYTPNTTTQITSTTTTDRVPLSTVPERERRIMACYRNLVREYELLVHRYLQVYRPATTIDRGTDPMEMEQNNLPTTSNANAQTSTPSQQEPSSSDALPSRCRLVLRSTLGIQTTTNSITESSTCTKPESSFHVKIKCSPKQSTPENSTKTSKTSEVEPSTSAQPENVTTPSTSSQTSPKPSDSWRIQLKRMYPGFIKKTPKQNRRPILDTSSDSSSDENVDLVKKRLFTTRSNTATTTDNSTSSTTSTSWNNQPTTSTSTNWNSPGFSNHLESNCQHVDRPICLSNFVANNGETSHGSRDSVCNRCGGNIDAQREMPIATPSIHIPTAEEAIFGNGEPSRLASTEPSPTLSQPCARTLMNTDTRTTNSTVYTPSSGPRRRFFSHVLSAFLPPRTTNPQPTFRQRQNRLLSLSTRNRLESMTRSSGRLNNFALDEVINYSERVNSEDEAPEPAPSVSDFHPFDPPPEFPSINPENIGIGNMYSNIVQDLESSLNNVRNIQASNRPGETSDMLSTFSERLESIMHQSDSILRNLRNTMDLLPQNSESPDVRAPNATQGSVEPDHPRFLFNDPSFYVRDQNQSSFADRNRLETGDPLNVPTHHEELFTNRSAIASDHTYPRNPESPRTLPSSSDNLTPLMTSLHLTISHIQRQARLLRVQVESIERIDRAMLEVAQIQTIRQMYTEVGRHINSWSGNDGRSTGVSSVRQMMAGTRISDSSPGNSSVEDDNAPSTNVDSNRSPLPEPSTSTDGATSQLPRQRITARKSFPPSRLLHIQRQNRRFAVVNFLPRRYSPRERTMRRRVYLRAFARASSVRLGAEMYEGGFQEESRVHCEYFAFIIRKLEFLLTEYIRSLGRPSDYQPGIPGIEARENDTVRLLSACRTRLNRLSGQPCGCHTEPSNVEGSSVTIDGASRSLARITLTSHLTTMLQFIEENSHAHISQNIRSQIKNAINLTFLLCDILLLHIVDSIPPPTGMNLDPERESLSARIDQMCSRMLQSRLSGQSHSLTRSLRLMRLTARYASRALGQTYNARRNAMFSTGNNSRRELIGQISNTLHNINRSRRVSHSPDQLRPNVEVTPSDMPMREWYQTINALVSRYNTNQTTTTTTNTNSSPGSMYNADLLERPRSAMFLYEDGSVSEDDNDRDWFNNNLPNNERRQTLYRTSNVNLLNNESTSQNRLTIPTVQINDVPISESSSAWHSRISHTRYRLSELRSNPTGGLFRPRFLHPLYSGMNPFDTDIDDPQREPSYDGDMVLTVTPNHRIQVWDMSAGKIPDITNSMRNVVVGECKIHNDASVDISADGTILVTLLPSGGYLNVTNRLGVYSLHWETLGQCFFITSFEQNAVSVSLSPLSRHLVVGLASRRVSIVPNEKWTMARIFHLNYKNAPYNGRLLMLRELEQNRDTTYMSLNCIRWLPFSGQGLIYATNTGQLRILS